MTRNMKLYKREITTGQYKTRKFVNFGMNFEEPGQFDGQWGMINIESGHKIDWESNKEITNIKRNWVKKIAVVFNSNILHQTKETSGSVNSISPRFRKKNDDL